MLIAKQSKQDEYYTQLKDIEEELRHYKPFFKDKIVFCNCDDPFESNFFKYFALNFNHLGLKKLICTSYAGSPISYTELNLNDLPLFHKDAKLPYMIEITEVPDLNDDGATDLTDIELLLKSRDNILTLLDGDGDFRSDECIGFLKEADIVVTNPPFSLFRDYIAQLFKYKKDFIILGNPNSLHYKEVFPYVQSGKIYVVYKSMSADMLFDVPEKLANKLVAEKKKGSGYRIVDGVVKGRAQAIWMTNFDISKHHEEFIPFKHYSPDEYPRYVNYDAIDVKAVSEMPCDYLGKMGVPDSFLEQYNPQQFVIVGYGRGDFLPEIGFIPKDFLDEYRRQGGRGHVTTGMKSLCYYEKDGKTKFPYSRIIIRYSDNWIKNNKDLFKKEEK